MSEQEEKHRIPGGEESQCGGLIINKKDVDELSRMKEYSYESKEDERFTRRRLILLTVVLAHLVVFAFALGLMIGGHVQTDRIGSQVEAKGYAYVNKGIGALPHSQKERDKIIVGFTMGFPWKPSRVQLPPYFEVAFFDETGRANVVAIGKKPQPIEDFAPQKETK